MEAYNTELFRITKTAGTMNENQEEYKSAVDKISEEFKSIVEDNTILLDKNKLTLTINDGKGKQKVTIPYKKNDYDKIENIKQTCQSEIAMNKNALLQDEFGNILLPTLDIIKTLYPFYNFQVRGMGPKLSIIHP
jgi:hypothetical protein